MAGIAAFVAAGAISRALLMTAGFALPANDAVARWFDAVALAASAAGGWLAVVLIDGVVGRVRVGIAVGVVAALTLAAVITTLSAAMPFGWRAAVPQCASMVLAAAVIGWRFNVTDRRRA